MHKIALMASGTGTNALNLIEAVKAYSSFNIELLIVDRKDSPLLKTKLPIKVKYIPKTKGMPIEIHESKIINELKKHDIHFILLCGYMKLLSENFIKEFSDHSLNHSKIFNIHPSYLPFFKGAHAYEEAFNSGFEFSGVTVHLIDQNMDEGKILFQEKFFRSENDTFESFKQKGREIEYKIYPKVFNWIEEVYGK